MIPREMHTVWACICIHTGLYTCVHMFRHTLAGVCIYLCVCTDIAYVSYTCVDMFLCTCTHRFLSIYIHVHMCCGHESASVCL